MTTQFVRANNRMYAGEISDHKSIAINENYYSNVVI